MRRQPSKPWVKSIGICAKERKFFYFGPLVLEESDQAETKSTMPRDTLSH